MFWDIKELPYRYFYFKNTVIIFIQSFFFAWILQQPDFYRISWYISAHDFVFDETWYVAKQTKSPYPHQRFVSESIRTKNNRSSWIMSNSKV